MELVQVGEKVKKFVSKENNKVFKKAFEIADREDKNNGGGTWHIGYEDIGILVDWIESIYGLVPLEGKTIEVKEQ